MDEGESGRAGLHRLGDPVAIDGRATGRLHPHDLDPEALGGVGDSPAEYAADPDHEPIPGLEEVDEHRLHPRAAGARDGKRRGILGLKDAAQQVVGLVGERQERRVEVPDRRPAHRLEHPPRDGAGPRAHQLPLG